MTWHTGDSSGPDEAADAIGIYNEHGELLADVVPIERQRLAPGDTAQASGGEEKVELMAAAPQLRDALKELLIATDPATAADHDEDVPEERWHEAIEDAKAVLKDVGVDV